ncbi:MAG TPA: hypothetical protein DCZ69_13895, partial [Syntrophobacteraceae bacterium]|nr:hypothetical protein [Syntrophobacteraceae bacterium]
FHQGRGIFAGVPSPFTVARYHSLQVTPGSQELIPLAHAEDGVIMGLQHRRWPLCGVQFHPESFMTEYGWELVANFLALQPAWHELRPPAPSHQDRFPRMGRSEGASAFLPAGLSQSTPRANLHDCFPS